jgi:hypothetical protein
MHMIFDRSQECTWLNSVLIEINKIDRMLVPHIKHVRVKKITRPMFGCCPLRGFYKTGSKINFRTCLIESSRSYDRSDGDNKLSKFPGRDFCFQKSESTESRISADVGPRRLGFDSIQKLRSKIVLSDLWLRRVLSDLQLRCWSSPIYFFVPHRFRFCGAALSSSSRTDFWCRIVLICPLRFLVLVSCPILVAGSCPFLKLFRSDFKIVPLRFRFPVPRRFRGP